MTRESTLAPNYGVLRVQPPQATNRYYHRNGETEPPAREGWYWFRGLLDDRTVSGLVNVRLPDAAFPTLTMSPEWVEGWVESDVLDGQWWGPIMGPWNEAQK